MDERQRREALGIGLAAVGLLIALAILSAWVTGEGGRNWIGPAGAWIHRGLAWALGWAAPLLVIPLFVWAVRCFEAIPRGGAIRATLLAGGLALLLPVALALAAEPGIGAAGAGRLGPLLAEPLRGAFGSVGAWLIVAALATGLAVLTLGWSPARTAGRAARVLTRAAGGLKEAGAALRRRRAAADAPTPWERVADDAGAEGEPASAAAATEPPVEEAPGPAGGRELPDPGDPSEAALPPLELLDLPERRGGPGLSERELRSLGEVLVEKLATYKVEGTIGGWTTGPVVTQFEVVPAAGVKVGRIAALADDLALALKAPSVRIVAPIPGKGAVGVEVPNPEPEIVKLREILESPAWTRSRAVLPLGLGRDLAGRPYTADLARMPHLLIAGATGSGKSVCINTIVTSLVYRYPPRDLRLLMIDPKMVELIVYNDLPHLRHPVVTDNADAAAVLKWTVHEMSRRYALLSANGCRNVIELNRRIERADPVLRPDDRGGGEYEEGPLPFIVLLIDELADLIMTVQAEVETPLAVLAQKARAVGIHLVVATQRPSVNVITGLIKANFPSRIAFRVASKIDSRTILDQNGAESLLGNGDMLFLPPGESDPDRIQGAFLSTAETERLVDWYRERARAAEEREETDILEEIRAVELEESQVDVEEEVLAEWDEYFRNAAEIVINHDQGSTSLLQRRLKIGYGRAARIIDQLHEAGVVGPPDGSRPREVLMSHEQLEALFDAATDPTEPEGG